MKPDNSPKNENGVENEKNENGVGPNQHVNMKRKRAENKP